MPPRPNTPPPKKDNYAGIDDRIDVERFIGINPDQLDKEWRQQPNYVFIVGEGVVDARRRRDAVKDKLDLRKSELSMIIRSDPESCTHIPLTKTTEGAISEAVECHPEIVKLKGQYNEMKYQHELLQNMQNSLEHKKKALENLVHLHMSAYYSNPKDPTGGKYQETAQRNMIQDAVPKNLV